MAVKPTRATVDRLTDEISRLRAFRERLTALKGFDQSPFWPVWKADLEDAIKGTEANIFGVLARQTVDPAADLADAKKHYGLKCGFEAVIDKVERVEVFIAKAEAEIEERKARLADASERVSAVEGD